jgi:hypothetical protein
VPDLAVRTRGGSVVAANDETFGEKENLIKPEVPAFQPHTFGHHGQIMDGWETRRRRGPAGRPPPPPRGGGWGGGPGCGPTEYLNLGKVG